MSLTALLPLIWAGILSASRSRSMSSSTASISASACLFPFAKDNAERDRMLASIAPFWDGNETWLVLGGGGLLVAFPRAYAIIMPAFYLPTDLDAAGAGVSRRDVRVPRHRAAQTVMECRIRRRLRRSPRSAKVLCSAASSTASRSRTAPTPAARSTGRRRSEFCAGSASSPATRCSARPG